MKNVKKYPKKQLEKYSSVFMQLALVLVLFIVYQIIEYESLQKKPDIISFQQDIDVYNFEEPQQSFKKEVVKKKLPKKPKRVIVDLNQIKKIDNNEKIPVKVIDKSLIDEEKRKIDEALNNYIDIDDDEIDNSKVPFILIEDAPVYKGCEGLSKEENKKCFIKSIQKFVVKRFDVDLAQDLGLQPGKYKIYAEFVIDKKGKVDQITIIRSPHPKLKKEVKSIIEKLPEFTPGMQRKVPVNVKFTLPVVFYVQ